MDDRELLELAAKAAGYSFNRVWCSPESGLLVYEPPANHESRDWNPLEDNADAFALMVTLGLNPRPTALDGTAECNGCFELHHHGEVQSVPAAVRRAIVRAAAEIGARK